MIYCLLKGKKNSRFAKLPPWKLPAYINEYRCTGTFIVFGHHQGEIKFSDNQH